MTTSLFRSPLMTVEPQWIDYNGHLNMAYYNVLFDRGVDALFKSFGFGADYITREKRSFFSAEFHVCYLRELHEGDQTYVTAQLLDYDAKRLHFFLRLHHADGWLSATGEGMSLHIDMTGPRVTEMTPDLLDEMVKMHEAQADLPRPEQAGRSVGIRRGG